jgi:ketosteroid isomerase-like protein
MSTNTAIIHKLYSDFQQAKVDAILAVCTEDTAWAIPAVGAFFASLGGTLSITEFTPQSYVQDGEWVWVAGHYAGHNPAGPGKFQSAWAHCWRLADGKVREFHDHFDTLAVAQAIGRR